MCWRQRDFEARWLEGKGAPWTPEVLYLRHPGSYWLCDHIRLRLLIPYGRLHLKSEIGEPNSSRQRVIKFTMFLRFYHARSFPKFLEKGIGVMYLMVWFWNHSASSPQSLATIPTGEAITWNTDRACSDAALSSGLWQNHRHIIPQSN